MTLQQMEYIVAVNKHRHFVAASEQCRVTQPTLSQMIQKLEQELGVLIFDRTKHPVEPTAMGERIIKQAEMVLFETRKISELVESEVKGLEGALKIGVIPTLAPYLIPEFIFRFRQSYATVNLTITELQTATLIDALKRGVIDMFIAATPLEQDDFYEIPLYYEKFVAYFATQNLPSITHLSAKTMPNENLWVLQEGHCVRDQIFNFCENDAQYNHVFEAGSIDTLIRIVDKNGGYSVIPELQLPYMTEEQKRNIREITCPPAVREISVVIRRDFVRERMLNAVADTIKQIMPAHMLDERLKKFSIKL